MALVIPGLVTVDPAARRFAFAVFVDGELSACGYARSPEEVSRHLRAGVGYTWVFETPRNYTAFAEAHKDLDRLRAVLKEIERYARRRGEPVESLAPSAWKGNVPKEIHHKRVWAVLSAAEKMLLPDAPEGLGYADDVHDAVALGVTRLQRLGRGGRKRRGRRR